MTRDLTTDRPTAHATAPEGRLAVTFLGVGALGAAMAHAYLDAGHEVTVWNRTSQRTDPIVEAGAVPAKDVATAVAASALVVVCVSRYDDARQVLEQAGDTLAGKTVANLGSGTAGEARAMARWVADRNAAYLDGAAMSGTRLVGQPTALFLYGGAPAAFAAHRNTLEVLGRALHLAEDPGSASLHDTALLTLNLGLLAGFYHAAAIVGSAAVTAADLAAIAEDYLPFTIALLVEHAAQIDARRYPSSDGTLAVYGDAVDHVLATSRDLGLSTELPAALRSMLSRAADAGWHDDGLARLIDVIRSAERSPSED